jgi:putative transposase
MLKSKVSSRHAFCRLQYHIVFATKYRNKTFKPMMKSHDTMISVFEQLIVNSGSSFEDFIVVSYEIAVDHVHMLLEVAPNVKLSDIVMMIKNVSAREYNKIFKIKGHVWERGYFAESIGTRSIKRLQRYIEGQNQDKNDELQ